MSEEEIFDVLHDLGLSKRESQIYLFLSHNGMQQAASVSIRLKIERVQTYRALKSLQDKGIVEATLEVPVRFSSVPFETLLDSLLRARKAGINSLETKKDRLVAYWQSISAKVSDLPVAKFRVIAEQKKIYEEVDKMIGNAKGEILQLTTSLGIIQEDTAGILDSFVALARKKPDVQTKILANVSKDNLGIMKRVLKSSTARKNIEWRHIDLGSRVLPQFSVMDGQDTILYVTHGDRSPILGQAETGLWIRSEMFASALKESFLEIWSNAVPVEDRIKEVETGKPVEETSIIRDPREAERRLMSVLENAKEDVIMITSSDALANLSNYKSLSEASGRTNYRVMAPIDLDNLEAVQNLCDFFGIRSVSISYLSMLAADGRHLFIFKTPDNRVSTRKTLFNFENVFYTNDARYVERAKELLDELWKRGIDVREMVSGKTAEVHAVEVAGSDSVTVVVDRMIKENVSSVIVVEAGRPVGIVSEKDVLERIIKLKKDPAKTAAKEIMSMPVMTFDASDVGGLPEALSRMRKIGITKLAVFRDGKLSGMLAVK